MLKELIRAIYEIAKAIKGESNEGGGDVINNIFFPFIMPDKIGGITDEGLKIFDNIEQYKNDNEIVDHKNFVCLYEKIENFEENYKKYVYKINIYDDGEIVCFCCNQDDNYTIQSATNDILNNNDNKDYYGITSSSRV